MNYEVGMALNQRLDWLLDVIERTEQLQTLSAYVAKCKEEASAIVATLVGDDPRVWESIDWLRKYYGKSESGLVMRDEEGWPKLRLRGNEAWVLADVEIGDEYGALDFLVKHAIYRHTGALYKVERDETVAEDPIYVPSGGSCSQTESLL